MFDSKNEMFTSLTAGEETPAYTDLSYGWKYTISDYTLYQITEHVALNIEGVNEIKGFRVEKSGEGIIIEIDLVLVYGYEIKRVLKQIQYKVKEEIENLTELKIKSIFVTAKTLVMI